MIIGNGALASGLMQSEVLLNSDTAYVAAGVSNSKEEDSNAFKRERAFIAQVCEKYKTRRVVYFSSFYLNSESMQDSKYAKNKHWVEKTLKEKVPLSVIIRVPNLVTPNSYAVNNSTLIPFLHNRIVSNEITQIQDKTSRYLVHVDDLVNSLEACEIDKFSKIKEGQVYDIVLGPQIEILEIYKYLNKLIAPTYSSNFKMSPPGESHRVINKVFPYSTVLGERYNERTMERFVNG